MTVIQVFYNPEAGSYDAATIKELMQEFRKAGAQVRLTPSVNTPPVIDPSTTHICIAGGDGTVRHVAAALVSSNRQVPVAIYPAGTVNLLAREGDMTRRPATLAQALVHGPTRLHNPAKAGAAMFFACASIGPDSLAVASVASSALKRQIGRFAYLAAILQLFHRWPRHRIVLSANGQSWDCEAVYIAKSRYYAGPWSFAPQAKGDDGKLHVVALRRAKRWHFLRFCWKMLGGADLSRDKNIISFPCTALSVHSDQPLPIQGDGDVVAMCPAEITIHDTPVHIC